MKKFYEVSKRTLLVIAGIVWMIAGFNVMLQDWGYCPTE